MEDFNPLWISEFKKTNAYEVWERITDPVLFDIVEPRSAPPLASSAVIHGLIPIETDTRARRNRPS